MRWIQWDREIKPSQIHATINGRVTLCSAVIPSILLLDTTTKPRKGKPVCARCKRAEEEARPYL